MDTFSTLRPVVASEDKNLVCGHQTYPVVVVDIVKPVELFNRGKNGSGVRCVAYLLKIRRDRCLMGSALQSFEMACAFLGYIEIFKRMSLKDRSVGKALDRLFEITYAEAKPFLEAGVASWLLFFLGGKCGGCIWRGICHSKEPNQHRPSFFLAMDPSSPCISTALQRLVLFRA